VRFQIPDTDLTFDIPDDWWRFAEMDGFRPQHPSYTWPSEAATDRIDFSIVPISAIEPPTQRMAIKPGLAKASGDQFRQPTATGAPEGPWWRPVRTGPRISPLLRIHRGRLRKDPCRVPRN
jgi:hypothetical protein